ncbi:DUF1270 family protein [Staphylococcus aureus]|nr:DUF1270 family protein [Staphylococcus aureus]MCC5203385.1 DUF1270 family protein [Staphylococcus aureus]MCC5216194.1 DUF1270 family protein [Staphylococcus aureus]MCC5227159.1 DUF1270 family protein [Staphylococcus aureus]
MATFIFYKEYFYGE